MQMEPQSLLIFELGGWWLCEFLCILCKQAFYPNKQQHKRYISSFSWSYQDSFNKNYSFLWMIWGYAQYPQVLALKVVEAPLQQLDHWSGESKPQNVSPKFVCLWSTSSNFKSINFNIEKTIHVNTEVLCISQETTYISKELRTLPKTPTVSVSSTKETSQLHPPQPPLGRSHININIIHIKRLGQNIKTKYLDEKPQINWSSFGDPECQIIEKSITNQVLPPVR